MCFLNYHGTPVLDAETPLILVLIMFITKAWSLGKACLLQMWSFSQILNQNQLFKSLLMKTGKKGEIRGDCTAFNVNLNLVSS